MFDVTVRQPVARLCLLLLAFACAVITAAAGVPGPRTITVFPPDILLYDTARLVPLQPLAEVTGAKVALRGKTITVTRDTHSFTCTLKSYAATGDGKPLTLDRAPFEHLELTYLPVAPLVESLGGTITFDLGNNLATITMPGFTEPLALRLVLRDANAPFIDDNPELFVRNLDAPGLRRLTVNRRADQLPTVSPDGAWLLTVRSGGIYLRPTESAMESCPFAADLRQGTRYFSADFTADGRELLITTRDKTTGQQIIARASLDGTKITPLGIEGSQPRMSPDGKTIAFNKPENGDLILYVADADGGNIRNLGPTTGKTVFSPDGSTIFFSKLYRGDVKNPRQTTSVIAVYHLRGAQAGTLTEAPEAERTGIELPGNCSPDGKTLVFARQGQGLWTMRTDRSDLRMISDNRADRLPAYTPDGQSIVFLRDRMLCSIDPRDNAPSTLISDIDVRDYTLLPDGKQLLILAVPERAPR